MAMFQQSANGNNRKRPSEPSEDEMDPLPLPPLRHWRVRRLEPIDEATIETFDIFAHQVEYAPILAFHVVVIARGEPFYQTRRIFKEWLDCEEIPVPESSALVH